MPDGRTEHDRITDLAIQVEHYAHATNTELRALRQGQDALRADVDELKTDVRQLKIDVAELKTDVAQLKTDVKELKADVGDLREGQKQMQDTMNENFRQLFVILNSRQG